MEGLEGQNSTHKERVWSHLLLQQSHLLFLRQNSDQNVALIPQDCHQRCNHSISVPGVHVY